MQRPHTKGTLNAHFFPSTPPWRQKEGKGRSLKSLSLGSQKPTAQSFPACANFLPRVPSYRAPQRDSRAGTGQGCHEIMTNFCINHGDDGIRISTPIP